MWTIDYPRERRENIRFRKWMIERACRNKRVREHVKERCRADLLWYINVFGFTFDPRRKVKSIPFITWPFQDRAFQLLDKVLARTEEGRSEDVVIEKSRDMGASWICLTFMEHRWHFFEGMSFLMVSRKEQLVDASGDPGSLFWKVDFIHRHLPEWLCPRMDRTKLHFGNLDCGSTIDGESTTAASGVGDRRTAVFIDEFSRIEEAGALLAGTADTTRCRIFNFTPYGSEHPSAKLAARRDITKLRLHWAEHPEKAAGLYQYDEHKRAVEVFDKKYHFKPDFNFILDGKLRSPWYDDECKRRDPQQIAVMLDIDYLGSSYQFFDKGTIVELQRLYAVSPYFEGEVLFDSQTGKPHGTEKQQDGPFKVWSTLDGQGRPLAGIYAIGGDLSMGTGSTNSCLSIVDCRTGDKVAEYASPFMRPERMALLAVALAWLFKDEEGEPALLGWEMQGPGVVFGNKVIDLGFRRVWTRSRDTMAASGRATNTPGWVPMPDAKLTLLEEYRTALTTRQFLNRCYTALEECLYFVYTVTGTVEHSASTISGKATAIGGGDPTGARANHGDRVIADAIAWMLCKEMGLATRKVKKSERIPVLSLAWRRQLAEKKEQEEAALGF